MSRLRALGRLSLLVPFTTVAWVLCLLAGPLGRVSRRTAGRLRTGVMRAWGRGAARVLGLRLVREGTAPAPPFFLVTNHLGYLDIVSLAACVPCAFVAKSEVAGWPVLGALAFAARTIFVRRGLRADLPRVVRRMQDAGRNGLGVVFFPEGTSSAGEDVLPFRSSLFEAPLQAGHPLFCASLTYATPAGAPSARTSVCWWGDMTFPDHFWGMLKLPRIDGRIVFGGRPVAGGTRKELARSAHEAVRATFSPVPAGGRRQ